MEAAPWSTVPWHVLVLMEEAVVRGVGAFSAEEAKRRGVRWLDLARDAKTKEALGALVDGFARRRLCPREPQALRHGRRGREPLGRPEAIRRGAAATSW